ncbi:hypothetical protein ACHAXS_004338 [Conticribra weissflogii]
MDKSNKNKDVDHVNDDDIVNIILENNFAGLAPSKGSNIDARPYQGQRRCNSPGIKSNASSKSSENKSRITLPDITNNAYSYSYDDNDSEYENDYPTDEKTLETYGMSSKELASVALKIGADFDGNVESYFRGGMGAELKDCKVTALPANNLAAKTTEEIEDEFDVDYASDVGTPSRMRFQLEGNNGNTQKIRPNAYRINTVGDKEYKIKNTAIAGTERGRAEEQDDPIKEQEFDDSCSFLKDALVEDVNVTLHRKNYLTPPNRRSFKNPYSNFNNHFEEENNMRQTQGGMRFVANDELRFNHNRAYTTNGGNENDDLSYYDIHASTLSQSTGQTPNTEDRAFMRLRMAAGITADERNDVNGGNKSASTFPGSVNAVIENQKSTVDDHNDLDKEDSLIDAKYNMNVCIENKYLKQRDSAPNGDSIHRGNNGDHPHCGSVSITNSSTSALTDEYFVDLSKRTSCQLNGIPESPSVSSSSKRNELGGILEEEPAKPPPTQSPDGHYQNSTNLDELIRFPSNGYDDRNGTGENNQHSRSEGYVDEEAAKKFSPLHNRACCGWCDHWFAMASRSTKALVLISILLLLLSISSVAIGILLQKEKHNHVMTEGASKVSSQQQSEIVESTFIEDDTDFDDDATDIKIVDGVIVSNLTTYVPTISPLSSTQPTLELIFGRSEPTPAIPYPAAEPTVHTSSLFESPTFIPTLTPSQFEKHGGVNGQPISKPAIQLVSLTSSPTSNDKEPTAEPLISTPLPTPSVTTFSPVTPWSSSVPMFSQETSTEAPTFSPVKTSTPNTAQPLKTTKAPITSSPSIEPTNSPTYFPTFKPTSTPTSKPSKHPSSNPTSLPTKAPSRIPTFPPSWQPSEKPTSPQTIFPTTNPSKSPILKPSMEPTHAPTRAPLFRPTNEPSLVISSRSPTKEPSRQPFVEISTSEPTIGRTTDEVSAALFYLRFRFQVLKGNILTANNVMSSFLLAFNSQLSYQLTTLR